MSLIEAWPACSRRCAFASPAGPVEGLAQPEALNRPEARPLAPADRVGRHGQLKVWPAFEESLKRALALNARKLVPEAEMYARAEGEMPTSPMNVTIAPDSARGSRDRSLLSAGRLLGYWKSCRL